LRGAFYQVINLYRQEKNESKIKNLERMMFDYEVERARKEENYRKYQELMIKTESNLILFRRPSIRGEC
jgi:hypothetical protein